MCDTATRRSGFGGSAPKLFATMQPSPEKTVRFSAPPRTMVPGLHAASRDGDAGRVQRMLEDGAPVDEKVSQPKPQP